MSQNTHPQDHQGQPTARHRLSGVGTPMLYRCPLCLHAWMQQGGLIRLRLVPAEVSTHLGSLSTTLSALPSATCCLCRFQRAVGHFEAVDYVRGQAGYGLTWEAAEPVGAHLLASVLSEVWLRSVPIFPPAEVVHDPQHTRGVLSWLTRQQRWPCVHVLDAQDQALLASTLPAGHGMSGTEDWQWQGALFRHYCPVLGGIAITTLAIALPPTEQMEEASLIALWQDRAALALQESVPAARPEKESR